MSSVRWVLPKRRARSAMRLARTEEERTAANTRCKQQCRERDRWLQRAPSDAAPLQHMVMPPYSVPQQMQMPYYQYSWPAAAMCTSSQQMQMPYYSWPAAAMCTPSPLLLPSLLPPAYAPRVLQATPVTERWLGVEQSSYKGDAPLPIMQQSVSQVHEATPVPAPPVETDEDRPDVRQLYVMQFGSCDRTLCKVFPSDAPDLLANFFEQVWNTGLQGGINPLHDTGKVREADVVEMKNAHVRLACNHFAYHEGCREAPPTGAIHGGWTAKAGAARVQSMRYKASDNTNRQLPYLWKIETAIEEHCPSLHNILAHLQYAMENMLLDKSPALWLRAFEAFGDLDLEEPHPGRLYKYGCYNQWVLNRNLLLGWHQDHFNEEEGTETLIVVERGPTGIQLVLISPMDGSRIVVASGDTTIGSRLAAVVGELHSIQHTAELAKGGGPSGPWGDRWSFGFYLAKQTLVRHVDCARAAGLATPSASGAGAVEPELAESLRGFGLPERAAHLRALQRGGWLAARYEAGPPWPLLSNALGKSIIPCEHKHPMKGFRKRFTGNVWPVKLHDTRASSKRPSRRSAFGSC